MLSQAILVVLDDYYAVMNRHDIDGIADVVTDDVIVHDDLFVDHVVRGLGESGRCSKDFGRLCPI
jgi:ketosteroid isomerase-like protein